MTMREKSVMQNAMMYSLLLDKGSGVYWDFDFDKEEFRADTACNVGLISGVTQKYEEGVNIYKQLAKLAEKAEEYCDNIEEA